MGQCREKVAGVSMQGEPQSALIGGPTSESLLILMKLAKGGADIREAREMSLTRHSLVRYRFVFSGKRVVRIV